MEKLRKDAFEFVGWLGFLLLLLAYALGSFSVWDMKSLVYQFFNLIGSVGLATIAFCKKDWQPATLNIIWAAIGVVTIFLLFAKF